MTAAPVASRGRALAGRRVAGTGLLLAPGAVLLVLFAAAPLVALVLIGFTREGGGLGLGNFTDVLGSATYTRLLGRTLLVAFGVSVLSIALGWPAAWALARYTAPRRRTTILGLVVIPYITSQLLLIYGFVSLVQAGGPLMALLGRLGLAGAQTSIMYTPLATFVMLVQESLPTAVLVMYSASERVDESLLEAARSLGAGRLVVLGRVVWPLCSAMVGVDFSLTFVQTVGAFAEPAILGGPGGQMLGNSIAAQLQAGTHQSFAVALSLVLLVASLVVVALVSGLLSWTRSLGGAKAPRRRPRSATPVAGVEDAAAALAVEGVLR